MITQLKQSDRQGSILECKITKRIFKNQKDSYNRLKNEITLHIQYAQYGIRMNCYK